MNRICAILRISLAFRLVTAEAKLSPCRHQTERTNRNYLLLAAKKTVLKEKAVDRNTSYALWQNPIFMRQILCLENRKQKKEK
jgi:hypothetical protein